VSTLHFLTTSDNSAVSPPAKTIKSRTGYLSIAGKEKNSAEDVSTKISSDGERVFISNIPGFPSSISFVVTKRARRSLLAAEKVSNSSNSLFLSHVLNISKASALEIRFLELVIQFGLPVAEKIAAIFRWKCQRPLRALRAMMYERGKNYSGRKRKPSSGSS
jgi:hypothetical protein